MDSQVSPDRAVARYFVSLGPSAAVVHIVGPSSFGNCRALARFLELHVSAVRKKQLYVNLDGCVSMDSTVAGLIAKCAFDLVEGNRWGRVAIINPQPRVHEMLVNLGLGHIADFIDTLPSGVAPGMDSLSRYVDAFGACPAPEIFRAHEALIALDESNVERFADVLAALRDDPAMAREPAVASPATPAAGPGPGLFGVPRGRIKFDAKSAMRRF